MRKTWMDTYLPTLIDNTYIELRYYLISLHTRTKKANLKIISHYYFLIWTIIWTQIFNCTAFCMFRVNSLNCLG